MSKLFLFGLLAVCLISMSGCSPGTQVAYTQIQDGKVEYYTDDPVDPMNYTLYLNKEITMVANLLSAHIINGMNVKDGYPVSDELSNVEDSLDLIAEAVESIETLHPPALYEDDRLSVLEAMLRVQDTLERYRTALSEDGDVESCVELMRGDYTVLTGKMQSIYWE